MIKFQEKELKGYIVTMAGLGFALSVCDVGELVESFVSFNELKDAKLRLKFKGRQGHPDPDWISSYMKRNNLSLKDAMKLSVARYNTTKKSAYHIPFYDILQNTLKELGTENGPDLFSNCDESGLPHEPKKFKVISEKGQKTL